MILKTMLRLIPDKLFTCNLNIHNDKGNIDILHVHTEKNTITNKFKFLLKNFWKEESEFGESGFDVDKFFELLDCSILLLSYAIKSKNETTNKKLTISKKSDTFYKKNAIDNIEEELIFGHLEL
jgi:hypothetical protein